MTVDEKDFSQIGLLPPIIKERSGSVVKKALSYADSAMGDEVSSPSDVKNHVLASSINRLMGASPQTDFKTRLLCVDDEVFNIEFFKCQMASITEIEGQCDFALSGDKAV